MSYFKIQKYIPVPLEYKFPSSGQKKRLQSPKDCIKSLLIPASCCSGDSSQLPQNQATGKSDQFSLKKLMVFIQLGLAQKVMHIIHILVNHCTRPTQTVSIVSLEYWDWMSLHTFSKMKFQRQSIKPMISEYLREDALYY